VNQGGRRGVLGDGRSACIDEAARRALRDRVSEDDALAQEFEARLRDSSSLAFRVAYGVLRQRQDLEVSLKLLK
jgi:hypothetical protein